MNILSAIGYNTQSNLKTAAGCGTEREQRHSTGGILKWQKIMRVKTRQKTIRLTKLPTAEMQWTARTAEKTAQRTLPETAQRTKLPMHMMHTTKHRMIILTDTKENCR